MKDKAGIQNKLVSTAVNMFSFSACHTYLGFLTERNLIFYKKKDCEY